MTMLRGSTLVRLGLVLVLVMLVGSACSLSRGGDDDGGAEAQPTVDATATPPPTKTAFPTFTPFPTLTPSGGFAPVIPTATRIAFRPTATRFPTWTPPAPTATRLPYDVRISYPVSGSEIAGYITVVGSASHPRFLQYALEWGPDPNPSDLWFALSPPRSQPVINGALGAWNTNSLSDGRYQLRVHVWLNDGTDTFALVTGLRVSNQAPTAVPTLTPTPRPNRAPQIEPIPSQQVDAGSQITIPVTTSDPDGDTVNLFASSSNDAIATVQVSGTSQIRVSGVTSGSTTITVTANDNNGGLTSTAFIVTVEGQNQAPQVSTVLPQTIERGQVVDVTLATSDPDADPLTVTANSENRDIVTASAVGTSAVRLSGVGVGAANVIVSVSDDRGATVNTAFQVTVGRPNQPPQIGTIPAQTLSAGDILNVNYSVTDPDGDSLQHQASSDTANVVTATVITPGTIQLVANEPGPATITLTVDDGENDPAITTFPVTVVAGNVAPTIDPISPQTMSVDESRMVSYTVVDPEGDTLDTRVSSDSTGVVTASIPASGQIELTGVSAGTATVTLTVDDGNNPAVSESFTVSVAAVNLPPEIETIFPQTLNVDETLEVPYAATDPDGDTLNESVTSSNPDVVTATINRDGRITLSGESAGNATVTLTVDDGNNAPQSMPFSVTVKETNDPPTVNPISPQTLNAGATAGVTFTASDPDGDGLTSSASSDNANVVTASVTAQNTIRLQGVNPGSATVTLSVTDDVNPAVETSFTVTVNEPNLPPEVQPIQAQTLDAGDQIDQNDQLEVAYTVSDPNDDTLTASASSDNPGVVMATVSQPGTILLRAASAGTANVTLSVTDNVNPAVQVTFPVTVNVTNSPPNVQPIGAQTLTVGDQLEVAYTASDPNDDTLTASASSDNPGVVTATVSQSGTILLQAAGAGTATVTLSVTDGVNPAVEVTFPVTVNPPNRPPQVQPIQAQTLTVGDQLEVAYTASDPNDDTLTASASSDNPGVVTATVSQPGTILLQAAGAGTANVTLSVTDGVNPAVEVTFPVTVDAPNNPPQVQPIQAQTLTVGDQLEVAYTASDPNDDTLTVSASSDNPGVVTATVSQPGTILLQAAGAGTANVTLSVTDGVNPAVEVTFPVTVDAPNNPPQVQPIQAQTLTVGDQLEVGYLASDPNGDTLTASASSDNPGVVTATVSQPGTILLQGAGAGTANVTLSVTDGVNPAVEVTFPVTVDAPNNPPQVQPIEDQTLTVGDQLEVGYTASDPNGDTLTASASSDNPGVVTATVSQPGTILLQGVAPGSATIVLSVTDNVNAPVDVAFRAIVNAENNPPQLQPVADQTLTVGEQISVPVTVSDPDGDPVALVATSQNSGVVTAQVSGEAVQLQGVAEGTATVELTADDAKGGVVTVTFNVTVSSPPGGFDLDAYPVVPEIPQPMGQSLNQLFQSGQRNFGVQAGAFARAGDETMAIPNFMAPFAGDQYNLGNYGDLQWTIDFFSQAAVRGGAATANSFDVDSVAAGEGYGIDTINGPANDATCAEIGAQTRLACELMLTQPSVTLVGFSAPNVTYLPPEQFRAELQAMVTDMLSNYGTIPVLATIPSGNGVTDEQLLPYNEAIVEVASQSGTQGIPLWNLWKAMKDRGITDPTSVAPEGPGVLTDAALNYGYNMRNLTGLQTLEAVRQAASIN